MGRITAFVLIVLLAGGCETAGQSKLGQNQLRHKELVAKANASIIRAAAEASKDPLRPAFHLTAPAYWINDPVGPVFYKGRYHLFYQHNPYRSEWGNMSWGHLASRNLVNWEHWPIALVPNPGSYDKNGVWSGCCVIDDGIPTIVYTGVQPEVQCIARSYDGMKTWVKFAGNPVIAARPMKGLEGFRDPFVWKDGNNWFMVIGSGIKEQGGAALLYKSTDLVKWEYLHPLCTGFGTMWECPNFFPLGDKYVLVVSPFGAVKYSVGTYQGNKFTPGEWRIMDLGGQDGFYAPNSMIDGGGRRIIWGWIKGGGTKDSPWNGMLTLPRVLSLRTDGLLGIEPAPELQKLRGKARHFENIIVTADAPNLLESVKGNCLEIIVEFEPKGRNVFGLEVLCSPDGNEGVKIAYDAASKQLSCGDKGGDFVMHEDEKTLRLHIFVDRSVVEIYANTRQCLTSRVYPARPDSRGLKIFSSSEVEVKHIDIWEMMPLRQKTLTSF